MIEQILSYTLIFVLGIFFANRNKFMQLFSGCLELMIKDMQDYIERESLRVRYIFDTHYYNILHKAKVGKYYRDIRSDLEHIKFIVDKIIGG